MKHISTLLMAAIALHVIVAHVFFVHDHNHTEQELSSHSHDTSIGVLHHIEHNDRVSESSEDCCTDDHCGEILIVSSYQHMKFIEVSFVGKHDSNPLSTIISFEKLNIPPLIYSNQIKNIVQLLI